MSGYFDCQHCGKRTRKNPRLKIKQEYCSDKSCQQARKNNWEKEKLKNDDLYRQRRNAQKAIWRKKRPSHQYQSTYRQSHPDYVNDNREKQQIRNKNIKKYASEVLSSNIVKTDALIPEGLIGYGLYKLLPYKTSPGQKIVKTDALIVELRAHKSFQKVLVSDSG